MSDAIFDAETAGQPALYRSHSRFVRPERSLSSGHHRRVLVADRRTRPAQNFARPNYHEPVEPKHKDTSRCDPWNAFVSVVTCCFFPICLRKCGKTDPSVQWAWREKIALIFIILLCCAVVAFLTFGLQASICSPKIDRAPLQTPPASDAYAIRGEWYFFDDPYMSANHPTTYQTILNLRRTNMRDISATFSNTFPTPTCDAIQIAVPPIETCNITAGVSYCHTTITFSDLRPNRMGIGVSFDWSDVFNKANNYIVFNGMVLDLTRYLKGGIPFLGEGTHKTIMAGLSTDATKRFMKTTALRNSIECLAEKYQIGFLMKESPGCFAAQVINYLTLAVIIALVMARFCMALFYAWFVGPKLSRKPDGIPYLPPGVELPKKSRKSRIRESKYSTARSNNDMMLVELSKDPVMSVQLSSTHVIILVTCYSEDEAGLRTTLESICETTYPNEQKVVFLVADGLVKGGGNTHTTPDICISLLTLSEENRNPVPKSYIAIADGSKQHNMAKVYAGTFDHNGNSLPVVLVAKCGTPAESKDPKPGNRGKRDSQIILMNFLSKVMFDDRMTPLEFELFTKIRNLTGVPADRYEIVLMVDADTKLMPDSLPQMVNAMKNDTTIMGLCGETRIANKKQSWVTRIQVYEYFISHHLAKNFESLFGGVTCLPGCFSAYRIKAPKGDKGYWVPILANPDIIEEYSQNVVTTLHQKNLLLLGEDRFLSTLMLKTFPKRKMTFISQAVCKTVVPDEFKVLLSQRRRWINSTIHNLMELVLVKDLCGTFCMSMQCVIALELFGTVVLPAAMVFTFILLVTILTPTSDFIRDSLTPLLMLLIILFLPSILILLTTRRWVYILWMFVYLAALPIWNFVLPLYAYWHFDDFSWGMTRQIEGESKGDNHGKKEGVFDSSMISMKLWHEWELERRGKKRVQHDDIEHYTPRSSARDGYMSDNASYATRSPRQSPPILEGLDGYLSDGPPSRGTSRTATPGLPVQYQQRHYESGPSSRVTSPVPRSRVNTHEDVSDKELPTIPEVHQPTGISRPLRHDRRRGRLAASVPKDDMKKGFSIIKCECCNNIS